ncbi:MAG: tRNA (adenosine(37)-N6)-threonylcarbamoyltransferase complex ATPase subunit type 1 TsaE [Gemmobacter sp.]
MSGPADLSCTLALPDAEATARLGRWLAGRLAPGDCLLLTGGIGAGKTHLARAFIAARQAAAGEPAEHIPSPSFTLVQTYRAGDDEIWHADLYRLGDPGEVAELGLDTALGTALCIVEWADRLPAALMPGAALRIDLATAGEGRIAALQAAGAVAGRIRELCGGLPDA